MLLMLLQERELGELLEQIARRIFGNLGQIAALVFVFGLPLIESWRRKVREKQQQRGPARPPRPAPRPAREQAEREAHGREVWEALLRGERPPEPPAPPPAPRPEPTRAPAPRPLPESRVPAPVLTASRPTPPIDEEVLAREVLERDLARGRQINEGALPVASVAATAALLAPAARRAVERPRSARELVLASEMLAPPVALRALDAGGSLPPGLAAW